MAETTRRIYARMGQFGELEFKHGLSGEGISPAFFENATFGYRMGGGNRGGGLIRLYAHRGQTNGPYAGDQWPSPTIEIDPWAGYSLYNYPADSTIGWHVVNTATIGAGLDINGIAAMQPAEAWIDGLAYETPGPDPDIRPVSEHTIHFADGREPETSNYQETHPGIPSGDLRWSDWHEGEAGIWTGNIAHARTDYNGAPGGMTSFDITVHLDPIIPPTGDPYPVRRRFT